MNAAQFLVAKYTPDLQRMEPRNFGIIAWADGDIESRFAGEQEGKSSTKIKPPYHLRVKSKSAYRKWVMYWKELINRGEIRSREGELVSREDPRFIDAIISKSKPQYRLVRGGEFLKRIENYELREVVDQLYEELISVGGDVRSTLHAEASRMLKRACRKAIEEAGLKERPGFYAGGLPWSCPVTGGEKVPFHFDYGIHLGTHPVAIMDRVKLWDRTDVYKTAFEFDSMRSAYPSIQKDNCVAMIYPTEEDLSSNEAMSLWKMLSGTVTVLDMRDPHSAASRLQAVSA